jgi:hypothetical protein
MDAAAQGQGDDGAQETRERSDFQGGYGGPLGGGPPEDRRPADGDSQGSRRRGQGRAEGTPSSNPGDDRRSGRGGGRRGEAAPGGAPNATGKAVPKSKVRVGRVGPKASLPPATLPAQYASRDTNQDGQIGMYEWSKTDFSTFRKLDLNGDGFLVPAELASPGTGSGGGSTSVASSSSTASGGYAAKAAPAAGSSAVSTPSGPPADIKTVAAQSAFDLLDTDKNGQLSEDEWNRSRYARKLFTEAKVELKLPLAKTTFVENYKKLAP